ncbi:MAG TPA: hypothetical protein VG079_07385, partial [Gaiellaceae bacterium]|nr:hypothetical protein [Gaiellaceae bacterium]
MDQGVPTAGRFGVDPAAGVETLTGVGPRIRERLAKLGLGTVRDLAEHLPRDYLDWSRVTGFGDLRIGEEATVECLVERTRVRPTRRRNLKIVEAVVSDSSGGRATAIWFNQAWLADRLVPGTRLLAHGQLAPGNTFKVDQHELARDGGGLHTVGLVPLYRASEEISTVRIRELTEQALPLARWFPYPLPAALRDGAGAPLRADAILAAHRPRALSDVEAGRRRLAFEELLLLQLGFLRRRRAREEDAVAPALGEEGELVRRYREKLPFRLTPEQDAAIAEIG